ncbi:hypothetical protein DC20_16325 [Rufibacter tibetensis]|uniref:Macroglobulin domain-containing protein n=2 Tax=Rufibacter tibetensis TaxID=512763 RepID=A0A0P0CZQ3_9BACT|nr:hypothetical protein DC20_16325 [Rufibacter tibetensis]
MGLALLQSTAGDVLGQTASLPNLLTNFKEHGIKSVQEKVFLHLDRPSYVSGDILWFKVYNVEGTFHTPFDLSKVAYVEVLDAEQKPVVQGKVALKYGTGNGSFVLPTSLSAGNYTVRAYTNWMKNFSPDYYFEQPITIINTFQPLNLPPVTDTASFAIQFFPEGGNLVKGFTSKVAFKGVNSNTGKGANFQGEVLDQSGTTVATFLPSKLGIGHFSFTPTISTDYTAVVRFPNGKVVRQKLPVVQEQGYTLGLEEKKPGELVLTARTSDQQQGSLYLLGHTRHAAIVAATAQPVNGLATFSVVKDSLTTGITHFTVFNSQLKPVAERLYFKYPTQQLEIDLAVSKPSFATREQVTLEVLTHREKGTPTTAELSLAVFKQDSLNPHNLADIKAYLWLSSDLKGTVENPSSYFTQAGPQAEQALDNLMLTHGWSRFTWDEVLSPQPPAYSFLPEYQGHLIKGKVTNVATGEPARKIRTYLSSPGKNIRFYSSVSTDNGLVLFDVKDFFGSKEVVVQTNFLKDSTYHFQLEDPFSTKYTARPLSALNVDSTSKDAIYARHLDVQAQNIYFEKYLNRYRAPGIDSLPFYGNPSKHYFLDDFTRFKVMEEVMREYVPGVMVRKRRGNFHFLVMDNPRRIFFEEDPLVLLDGVPVFDTNKIMAFDPLKIERLDVMESKYYNGSLVSHGVVSYTTYKGDLAGFPLDTRALLQEYEGLQLQREFYAPTYSTDEQKLSRLPDWRNLLYWSPNLITGENGKASSQFYTADQAGTYTIFIQGLTREGLPGSKMVTFEVKKPL